jgi:hypothetical protein
MVGIETANALAARQRELLPAIADDNEFARTMLGMARFENLGHRLPAHHIAWSQADSRIDRQV